MEERGEFVRKESTHEPKPIEAADGLEKTVLVDESSGAEAVAIRRFALAPGGSVPVHTNEVEHAQYVLTGEYVVGIDGTEYTVSPGDALHIPAGVEHWYRNDGAEEGAFICAVPTGDDEIRLVE